MIASTISPGAPHKRYLLWGNRYSGHAYKVRLALLLLGIEHEYRTVDILQPREERDPAWQRVSPFGEVPVLETDGGALVQSNAILLHLGRVHHALGWERDPDGVAQWLSWEANRIGLSLANLRFLTLLISNTRHEAIPWLRERLASDLATLDRHLSARSFLLDEQVSAADLACAAYLLYRDLPEVDLTSYPAVSAWLDRFAALPGWIDPGTAMRGDNPTDL
jgi:glutathione S-transferase